MKAISTKYHGPGNRRGSRFSADDGDGNRVYVSYDYGLDSESNHHKAALALCQKMGWTGEMVAGSTKDGMTFVWVNGERLTVR